MSGRAFIPTDIGKIVSKFLVKYLGTYVEYGFTAQMEDVLDEISNGEKEWQRRARPVLEAVHQAKSSTSRKTVTREEVAESREIGSDPVSGKPISRAHGRSTARSCSRARATIPRSRASRASCPASTWTTSRSPTR